MKAKVKTAVKKKVVAKKPAVKRGSTASVTKNNLKGYKDGGLTTYSQATKSQRAKEKYYDERRYMHDKTPGPQTKEEYLKSVDKQFGQFRTPGPKEEATMERQERMMREGYPTLRTKTAKPIDPFKKGGIKKSAPKKFKTGGVKKSTTRKKK
jgi:hypothetical protein